MELITTEEVMGIKNSKALIKDSRKRCSRPVARAEGVRIQKQSNSRIRRKLPIEGFGTISKCHKRMSQEVFLSNSNKDTIL